MVLNYEWGGAIEPIQSDALKDMKSKKIKPSQIFPEYSFSGDLSILPEKSISVSNWCVDCFIEGRFKEAEIVFEGDSLCLDHFQGRREENE